MHEYNKHFEKICLNRLLFRNSKLNAAGGIATGCVKMTSIDHLHEETKMLPVQDHLSLISSQYFVRALQPNNPSSHSVVTSPWGNRNMKPTLQSQFLHCVSLYLSNGVLPPLIIGSPSSSSYLSRFRFQVSSIS